MMQTVREDYVNHLKEHGPSVVAELPHSEPPRRFDGIGELRVNLGGHGAQVSATASTDPLAYLKEEHSRQQVVKYWCQYHDDVLELYPHRSIYMNTPEVFRPYMREYLDEDMYDGSGGNNKGEYGGVCPVCGDEYDGMLQSHLRNDCT